MKRGSQFPGFWQAIGLLLVIGILAAGFQLLVSLPALGGARQNPLSIALELDLAILLVLFVSMRMTGLAPSEVIPLRAFRASLLGPIMATIVGLHILDSEVDNVVRKVLPPANEFVESFEALMFRRSIWISIVFFCLLAPVSEELLFRGLILRGFLGRYRPFTAIVVSSFLFAVFHANVWQFVGPLAIGLLFGWWRASLHSVIPCLFGHAFSNLLPVIAGRLPLRIPGYTERASHQPLWFDLLGFVILIAGIVLLRRAPELRLAARSARSDVPPALEPTTKPEIADSDASRP